MVAYNKHEETSNTTVQELYDFAKERNILDYEIEAQYADDGGYYYGSRITDEGDIERKDDIKTIII